MTELFQDNLPFPETADAEGLFDAQLTLPLPTSTWGLPIQEIIKRNGQQEPFDKTKIAASIAKASVSAGVEQTDNTESIAAAVQIYLGKCLNGSPATVDQVSDAVERVLIQMSQADVALSYARYRDRRARIRRLRQGDIHGLLGELQEAQCEKRSAIAASPLWRVCDSRKSIEQWDLKRSIEALCGETHIDQGLALLIAVEVEKQIQAAGITLITEPLMRELVGAKLVEHGLVEENDRLRRLGLPVRDITHIICGAFPGKSGTDPIHTDKVLAHEVKKEYALTEVFAPQVTLAHLNGELHLNDLSLIDRLYSAEHSFACPALHESPWGRQTFLPAVPDSPDTLLTQFVRFSDVMDRMFITGAGWYAFNCMIAPFLDGMTDEDMRRFADMVLDECAYRNAGLPEGSQPIRIALNWKTPKDIADIEALGGCAGRNYYQYEVNAQRFAWAMLQSFYEGGVNAANFSSPQIRIILDDSILKTFEGLDFLTHASKVALRRPNIYFVFRDKNTVGENLFWQPRNVIWHRVAINLPRAANKSKDSAGFFAALDRLCSLACDAHQQKSEFIEMLLKSKGTAPLAPLALEYSGYPYVSHEKGLFAVDVEGLSECVTIMCSKVAGCEQRRNEFAETILKHLNQRIKKFNQKTGMNCILSANKKVSVSSRFAALDAEEFPEVFTKIASVDEMTQALTYSQGVSWAGDGHISPYDKAKNEGLFHQYLQETAVSCTDLGLANASEKSLCDLLTMIMCQTACDSIYFTTGRES